MCEWLLSGNRYGRSVSEVCCRGTGERPLRTDFAPMAGDHLQTGRSRIRRPPASLADHQTITSVSPVDSFG
jgi:hypothetical protein